MHLGKADSKMAELLFKDADGVHGLVRKITSCHTTELS